MPHIEQQILAQGIELFFKAGEYLFRESQAADFAFFLKDGSVELCHDQPIVIQKQKCFLGLRELILEHQYPQSVRVKTPSILLVFDRDLIKRLIDYHPASRRYLLQKMSYQFRVLEHEFE